MFERSFDAFKKRRTHNSMEKRIIHICSVFHQNVSRQCLCVRDRHVLMIVFFSFHIENGILKEGKNGNGMTTKKANTFSLFYLINKYFGEKSRCLLIDSSLKSK